LAFTNQPSLHIKFQKKAHKVNATNAQTHRAPAPRNADTHTMHFSGLPCGTKYGLLVVNVTLSPFLLDVRTEKLKNLESRM
jgi:hypothetical protein